MLSLARTNVLLLLPTAKLPVNVLAHVEQKGRAFTSNSTNQGLFHAVELAWGIPDK